jgi:hypothetical protein
LRVEARFYDAINLANVVLIDEAKMIRMVFDDLAAILLWLFGKGVDHDIIDFALAYGLREVLLPPVRIYIAGHSLRPQKTEAGFDPTEHAVG